MLNASQIDDLIHMRLPQAEIRSQLMALTPERIDYETFHAFLEAMRKTVEDFPTLKGPILDCCGTGGSGLPHFNTSTTVAFILAAGGIRVVKFGNRAMTSQSGSFDFLEALNIPLMVPLSAAVDCLDETGIFFLYAPQCYPSLAAFTRFRRELPVNTIFNFLGPLLNPARPALKLLGVSNPVMQGLIAETLSMDTFTQQAWVVRAENNLDEIAPDQVTYTEAVSPHTISKMTLTPTLSFTERNSQASYKVKDNITRFQALINGEDTTSITYHTVCINAAAGFVVAGIVSSLDEGVTLAAELLRAQTVLKCVQQVQKVYALASH